MTEAAYDTPGWFEVFAIAIGVGIVAGLVWAWILDRYRGE